MYDGITGIVTDPYKGAKKEGGVGFVKGVGRGIFSVPFRVMGGAWAVPGYAMKGLYQEMIKSKGNGVQNYIIAARISQGYDESLSVTPQERADIVSKWKIVKVNAKRKKNPGGETIDSLHSLVADKRKRKEDRWNRVNSHFNKPEARPSFPPSLSQHTSYSEASTEPVSRTNSNALPAWKVQEQQRISRITTANSQQSQQSNTELEAQLIAEEEAERRELEAAIAASVAENSHGNAEEDQLMARAVRASVAELERAPANSTEQDEEEALKRAMQVSLQEAGRSGATEEEQKLLEETLRKSLLDTSRHHQHGSDSEWDSSDTEDDADFQRIMAESKELAHLQQHYPQDYQNAAGVQESGVAGASGAVDTTAEDEELRKVLEESERAEKERQANASKEKTEDEIVMEYIKKQSLLEEEHRQRRLQGRDTAGESSGAGASASGP